MKVHWNQILELNIRTEFEPIDIKKSHGSKDTYYIYMTMYIQGLFPSLCQVELHIIMN